MKKLLLIIALLISGLGLNAQVYDSIEIDYGTHSLYYSFQIDYSYEIHFDSVFYDGDYYYYYDTLVYADTSEVIIGCNNYSNVLSITIPSTINGFNVTSIGDYPFAWVGNLIEIEIPNTVTSIGGSAFYNCYNLRSIVCHAEEVPATESEFYYDENPFYGCHSAMTIYVPENSVGLYQAASPWNNYTIKSIEEYEEPFNPFLEFTIDYGMYSLRYESDSIFYNITGQLSGDILKVAGIDVYAEGLSVEIPSKVTYNDKEYTVTSIGDYAFYNCYNLTNIEIPSSVTSIGSSAFYNCNNLTSIELPSSVTSIGYEAFWGCSSLTNIEIPSSVTSIGYEAFWGCSSLTSIELPSDLTSIGGRAFFGCYSLISIELPSGVTYIGNEAFYDCYNLTSLICHSENVPYAEDFTFEGCYNMTIYVPKNSVGLYQETYPWNNYTIEPIVERDPGTPDYTMDFGAYFLNFEITNIELAECELSYASEPKVQTTITIPSSVTIEGEVYSVTSISDSAFLGCNKFIGDLIIPNTVTSVGIRAFRDCVGFTSLTLSENLKTIKDLAFAGGGYIHVNYAGELTIPSSVEYIGDYAFQNCSSLTSLKFEENSQLTSIEQNVFRNCSGFTGDLVIPNTVEYIGNYAFYGCSGFTGDLVIPNSVTYIGEGAFWECAGFDGTLTLPVNIDTISDYAFGAYNNAMNFTGDLVIPSSVEYIGEAAFQNCSSLTSLKFEENSQLTSIGNYAFYGCSSLTSIELPNGVTSIGYYAFSGCSSLTSIEIPNGVTSIGGSAFSGCSSLTSIEIPSSVTSIGGYAFANCSSLTSIEIPSGVTSIGYFAFDECSSLTSIYCYAEIVPETGSSVFAGCPSDMVIYVPAISVNAYKATSPWNNYTIIALSCAVTASSNPEEAGVITGTGEYTLNDTVTLKATANEGYKFVSWTENGELVSIEKEFSFVVTTNRNFVANFEKTCEITAIVNPEKVGVVIGSGVYFKGDNVTLTAIAMEGYKFVNWTEDGEVVSEDAQYSFVVEGNRNLVANFDKKELVGTVTYNVTTTVNPEKVGVVIGSGLYFKGDNVTLTAIPIKNGYEFVNWTEGDKVVSEDAQYSFVIESDRELVANFVLLEYYVSAAVSSAEAGEVAGDGNYNHGDTVALVATANTGYKFVNWTENGVVVSEDAQYSFVILKDRELTANFVSTEGVEELEASFNIYPNPVSDMLFIETEVEVEEVVVYDVYGRQQSMVNGQQSTVIDVSNLNSGVYFVKVVTSEGEAVKRFIKK